MASFKKYLDENTHTHTYSSYTLRFLHYDLKTKLSLHLFWLCFYRKQKSDPTMENTFSFPSIHYSQFKRINLPNAQPRSHYSKPPVAPRCLLASKHLSLTRKPRHKPAPTHSHPHFQPHEATSPNAAAVAASTGLLHVAPCLRNAMSPSTPNLRQNPLLLSGDPAHARLPRAQASSVPKPSSPGHRPRAQSSATPTLWPARPFPCRSERPAYAVTNF